jgi:mannose-1-phosphate guanylyltransferase
MAARFTSLQGVISLKAFILAGGLGTRLRPLTYTRPKHMLPIANRPHIEHVFDLLEKCGVQEIVLLTSYLAEHFAGVVEDAAARGLDFAVAHEEKPLGTAGAFKNAEDLVGDEAFLAFNGDILTDIDLDNVLEFHRTKDAEATIVLTPVEDPSAYGVVPTDDGGRVLGFIEKPPRSEAPTNLINAGIYVFEPTILDRVPAGKVYSAERELFPGLVEEGARLFATGTDAYWMDIGTPKQYLRANLDALLGRYRTSAVESPGNGAVLSSDGAQIAATASVRTVCLGRGARIEDGSTVERSVLLPGAVVGAGANVQTSIVGEDARVRPGAVLSGAAIADGQTVDSSK